MRVWELHIERPTLVHTVICFLVLNVLWTMGIGAVHYFQISDPVVLSLAACVAWHIMCSSLGIEPFTEFPANMVFHICGNVLSILVVFMLFGL